MENERRSKFLEAIGKGTPTEDPQELPIEEQVPTEESAQPQEVVEPPVEAGEEGHPNQEQEEDYFAPFYDEAEPVVEPTLPTQEEVKLSQKVSYNLKQYADEHSEVLSNYYKYKNLDVDSMSQEQLLRLKLEQENPSWDSKDIQEEMKDLYGIGLTLPMLPDDPMNDELKEFEIIKSKIEAGQRRAKSDVQRAKDSLKQTKENLQLPDVEFDVEVTQDPTKVIEQYNKKAQEEAIKYREETWIPNISEAVSKLSGFKQKFDVEGSKGDKVVEELSYKFTDAQKEKLKSYLSDYVPHPTDVQYQDENGTIDYTRFVSDTSMKLFSKDILSAAVKEATAKLRQKFVKEDMVNYQDEPRRISKGADAPKDNVIARFEKRAADRQMRAQGNFR